MPTVRYNLSGFTSFSLSCSDVYHLNGWGDVLAGNAPLVVLNGAQCSQVHKAGTYVPITNKWENARACIQFYQVTAPTPPIRMVRLHFNIVAIGGSPGLLSVCEGTHKALVGGFDRTDYQAVGSHPSIHDFLPLPSWCSLNLPLSWVGNAGAYTSIGFKMQNEPEPPIDQELDTIYYDRNTAYLIVTYGANIKGDIHIDQLAHQHSDRLKV